MATKQHLVDTPHLLHKTYKGQKQLYRKTLTYCVVTIFSKERQVRGRGLQQNCLVTHTQSEEHTEFKALLADASDHKQTELSHQPF